MLEVSGRFGDDLRRSAVLRALEECDQRRRRVWHVDRRRRDPDCLLVRAVYAAVRDRYEQPEDVIVRTVLGAEVLGSKLPRAEMERLVRWLLVADGYPPILLQSYEYPQGDIVTYREVAS